MPFINLNRTIDSKTNLHKSKKKNARKIAIRILLILLVLFAVVYLPLRGAYSAAKRMVSASRAVSEAVKNENLDDIRSNLRLMKSANDDLNGSLAWLFWVRAVPYIGNFYADAKHFASAAQSELTAANMIADSLDPYKTELGFTGSPTPGIDRLTQFVKILDKITPQLDKIQPYLKKARAEVSSIDVSKYPESFGKTPLKSRIDVAKNFIIGADIAISDHRDALSIAPSALGQPTPKTYLLIFQNDKELRATGGFMTAYAFLTFNGGHISSTTSDDIYRLDEKLLERCRSVICPLTPPDPIVRFLPEANGKPKSAWSMRDSNLSPDVPTSMQSFEKMYSYLPNAEKFDGIILIDTNVVEQLIKITGPIEVYGTTYSADFDKRCNCPNVIYGLESYAQIIEKGEQGRKAILGQLMQQLLARSLGASADKMPEFINAGIKLANSKHILMYMHDNQTQDALARLNWTGQIQSFNGDYLHINDSNFAGGKSNLYVNQEVTLDKVVKDGRVVNKLTINYSNTQKYGIWLNAINRDYVRVYVPRGSRLISSKGSEVQVGTFDELGKTVFDAFIQVRPQNSLTLQFEYEVPGDFGDKNYPLLIQKQPGSKDFLYTIKVNGQQRAKFNLSSDQNLNLAV